MVHTVWKETPETPALGTIWYSKYKKNLLREPWRAHGDANQEMSTAAIGIRKNSAPRVSPDAIPRPPRVPSIGPGQPGAASGTRRVEIPAVPKDEFPPEEPTSFDTRRTPVVPARWPEQDDEPRSTQAALDIEIETPPKSDTASASAPVPSPPVASPPVASPPVASAPVPSAPVPSAPVASAPVASAPIASAPVASAPVASAPAAPLAGGEVAFFDAPPQYSLTPPVLVSEPPLARPSLLRSVLAKMLFVLIAGATVMLLCYEASVATHTPSLDPRRLIEALLRG